MMPLCREEKTGSTPHSPMASGRLSRDWSETTRRLETDNVARAKYDATQDADKLVVDRVAELAARHGVTRSQISLEEIEYLQEPYVPHNIVGHI